MFEAYRKTEVFKYLVEEKKVDVNVKDVSIGRTVLFDVCMDGNLELVKILIENGADVNVKDVLGQTALFNACENGNRELLEYMIKHGADVNVADKEGKTLLYFAKKNKYFNKGVIDYLKSVGAKEYIKVNKTQTSHSLLDSFLEKIKSKL